MRKLVTDVKVIPGEEVALQHQLLVCDMRFDVVGGKKGNRTEPNQRIIPDGAYGNFRLQRYRVLPPSPNRTNKYDIYCLFYCYIF